MKDRLKKLPVVGTAIRMQERYVNDAADALAASIGLFGFLSLFPLLALALAVVGFVLQGDGVAQARVVDLVQDSIPAFSSIAGGENGVATAIATITDKPGSLLGFGTVGLVLAGLRIASGAQQASAVVFRVERPTGLSARLGQVRALVVVGTFALVGAALTGSVGVDLGSGVAGFAWSLARLAVAFALDVGLFLLAYRLFTPISGPAWRTLLPGSLLAAAGWMALKLFGTTYVASQAQNANNSYGALGSIIALLLLFYIAGRLYLYGAELAALLGHVDEVPMQHEMVEDAVRVPRVSPRPHPDVQPEPADATRLAVTAVVLGAAAAALARLFRD